MCSRSIRPDSAGPAPFRAEQQVFGNVYLCIHNGESRVRTPAGWLR
jgi:hypothetical protein